MKLPIVMTIDNYTKRFRNSLQNIDKLIRWNEWYDSKIPLFFIVFYHLCLIEGIPTRQVVPRFAFVTGYACFYLAFGYFINDYFDRESDRKAGKQKIINSLSEPIAVILLFLLGIAGFITSLLMQSNFELAILLSVITYFFAIFYSMPPIRFKERGVWGLLVSSVAQRSFPSLLVFCAFNHFNLDTWLFFLFLGFMGIRWILVHQLIDLQNDLKAGIMTFATNRGCQRTECLLKRVIFPLELGCILALWVYGMAGFPIFWAAPVSYVIIIIANWLLWKKVESPYNFSSFDRQPLSDFYFVYWPIALAFTLALKQPIFWLIFVFNVLWQGAYILRHGKNACRQLQLRLKDD